MIKVSIIIVNYNVKALLIKCLESIYRFDHSQFEIIVVDNHSADDSVKTIRTLFPDVKIIANDFNAGFPKANNQGFAIASGQYLMMLNPDTELTEDSINILYNYAEQHNIDVIAPMLLNTDKSFQQSVWRYPNLSATFFEMHYMNRFAGYKNYADKDLSQPFEAESFSGAAILFKRSVLNELKGLDENLFWIEDIDFCYRAKQKGYKLMYYPLTKIIHHIGQSAKKNYNVSVSNQVFNKIKFFKTHYSSLKWLLITALSFYHCLLKLIVFGILSPLNVVYYRKAKAYWYTLPKVFNPPSM